MPFWLTFVEVCVFYCHCCYSCFVCVYVVMSPYFTYLLFYAAFSYSFFPHCFLLFFNSLTTKQ